MLVDACMDLGCSYSSLGPKPGIRRSVKILVYNNATLPLSEAASFGKMLLAFYVPLIALQPLGTSSLKQVRQP